MVSKQRYRFNHFVINYCKNSGYEVIDHFAEVDKIVEAGATSKPIIDYKLSRYACYLIVQNGDPRKEVIALGQTYFTIQHLQFQIQLQLIIGQSERFPVVFGDAKPGDRLTVFFCRITFVPVPTILWKIGVDFQHVIIPVGFGQY